MGAGALQTVPRRRDDAICGAGGREYDIFVAPSHRRRGSSAWRINNDALALRTTDAKAITAARCGRFEIDNARAVSFASAVDGGRAYQQSAGDNAIKFAMRRDQ